ncbi:MAG TPA: HEAT repeat domain-containing protein [Chthoniobacteraceae bacterium]|jgi:mono/diheme cytochrome c family protein/glucose/arabinose dehydrogenase|nr:HEAT repeat domain-containing protein [Chthoniobacteraceae bacterium]
MSEPTDDHPPAPKPPRAWLRWLAIALIAGLVAERGVEEWQRHHRPPAKVVPASPQKKPKAAGEPGGDVQPLPVLSPEEERASFTIQPGFHAELVAAEPLIHNPVALAFGPDGRLWVCEMQGYMQDAAATGEKEPLGRVVILEDTDGDGRMDKSTVFLEGLVLPRAIALVRDGVLIGEPPHLWFCRDTDGDGKCDEKTEVDPKFALANQASPEHLPNGLLWAMDNSLYNVNSAVCYREKPDGGFDRLPTAFRGQWGIAQDDWGKLFYNHHVSHLYSDITPAAHYQDRNKFAPNEFGLSPLLTTDERVWPSHDTPGVNAGPAALVNGRLKLFTSACGPTVYRGELFPPEYRGNAFVCEPAGNLIKRNLLHQDRGVTKAENAAEGSEFFASSDERCRPVSLYTGPDGALWVVDMYCGIIEHKDYMRGYLKKHIHDRALDKPLGLGRLWRIVPDGAKPGPLPKLPRETAALVAELEHPNGWRRDTAQRLLVEGRDPAAAPALAQLFASTKSPLARLHALWTLHGLGQLDPALVDRALGDPESGLRAAAIRLSEDHLGDTPAMASRVIGMVSDPAAEVRLQALLSLGDVQGKEAIDALIDGLERGEENPYVQVAAWTGLGGRELQFIEAFLASPVSAARNPYQARMIRGLMFSMLSQRKPDRCLGLLDLVAGPHPPEVQSWLVAALAFLTETDLNGVRPLVLERAPAHWAELAGAVNQESLKEVADLFTWPGKVSQLEPEIVPFTPEEQTRFAEGKILYTQICATCHQADGHGLAGLAPPLVNSEWAVGSHQRLVRIVLNGVAGPIPVAGRIYYMEMPALATLNDDQIAAILTYIRREWEHTGDPVAPAEVAEIRAAVGPRDHPWNVKLLHRFK